MLENFETLCNLLTTNPLIYLTLRIFKQKNAFFNDSCVIWSLRYDISEKHHKTFGPLYVHVCVIKCFIIDLALRPPLTIRSIDTSVMNLQQNCEMFVWFSYHVFVIYTIVIKSILEIHIIHYIDTYIADKFELLYKCFSSPFSYMYNM